ncbi:DNA (cytosine-5-)-methyltransferase [Bifidobacterium longum subsp. longum 1-6B]|uniref:DNA (cytosine-5-)-methyltransferase n=1 Tax=Bifidobacterium longum subsp. longum 1-6B TaxID=1161744 RepID=A0AA87IER0_BIFLL|nr:DNA (cytosine-5-)-methyltransferase [Bifidobacterium longum]EIJ25820.1 DNA (cytosine-5-)-methyltransferase [Bifidobacterium longum subsp. longum 1-6B]EIJ32713.1 DNA (cytosine-5-)-methyltransferase [Bifidobacterium longum subsp. longum 44B]MDM3530645.1 DNA (cytosine-5-)-methyltransferase [Bifidobacterium longum]
MKYVSIFSGIEAATVAWHPLGWEPLAFSEIDPFPSTVLQHHYPNVPNLGDITKIDWNPYKGQADLVVGGSPCFPSGTLILTSERLKPIEEVKVGDMVLTHLNRWRRVIQTGSKISDTIVLKGQGVSSLECTPNHPFWSTGKTKNKHLGIRQLEEPKWLEAENMPGRMWLNMNATGACLPIPDPNETEAHVRISLSTPFFYFVGRWLGDGWANSHKRKNRINSNMKRVYVCCAHELADDLEKKLEDTGLHFGRVEQPSTTRFTCSSMALFDWLTTNFGIHAAGKNLPSWVFGMKREWRQALFDGYLESDGCILSNGKKTTSISLPLTTGMKILASGLGKASSVTYSMPKRKLCVIEGRIVNEHGFYSQTYYSNSRSALISKDGFWGLVRKKLPGRKNIRVYNLEVEDDHSYVAAGIAVHNCQSFSVAGKREGLAGASGLMFEYIRAVRELRPRWFVWENVPGAFTSERGEAYRQLLSEMDALGYGLAWRVLDAQFFGVAQRRERVFLVGSLGTMRCAEVLFERESLSWNHQSSRQKRQALTEEAQERVGEADHDSGCLNPGETQSRRVYPASGVYPTLSTREKSGQNQESVFTQFGDNVAGTLTSRYDSSPCVDRGANVVVDERDKVFLCQTAQTGSNGKLVKQDDVMNTLDRTNSTAVAALDFNPTDARLRYAQDDVSQTLTARAGTGGNQVPLVQVQPLVFNPNAGINEKGGGFALSEDVTPTLKIDHNPAVAFASNQRDEVRELEVAGALAAQPGIKQQTYICRADGQANAMTSVDMAPTLTSHAKKDPPLIYPAEDSIGEDALIQRDMSATLSTHNTQTLITGGREKRSLTVRRLTPRECERLQGFPDDYTDIPYRNKEHAPDGPRYKALGNSMAVPVMRWIGERIRMVEG